jgi:hypothetical protein
VTRCRDLRLKRSGPAFTGPTATKRGTVNVQDRQDVEQPEAKPRSFRWQWVTAVMDDPDVPMVDKLLAHTLAACWMDNDTGRCRPSTETIAARMSAGRRTVQEHLHGDRAALVTLGYLVIHEGGNGPKDTNEYEAKIPLRAQLAHAKGAADAEKGRGSRARTGSRTGESNWNKSGRATRKNRASAPTPTTPEINPDTHAALAQLVGEVDGFDEDTLHRFTGKYGHLLPDAIEYALGVLDAKLARFENGDDTNPITGTVAAYLSGILWNIANGYSGYDNYSAHTKEAQHEDSL